MNDATDIRQIVFTNLQLLGFDPAASERKWRVPFNKEMFCLPNKRGFEVVMYFLFQRLNPAMCREQFRTCWEVHDKKQEQQFRKTCNNWLAQIAKEDQDAHFPRIVASLFMSPGGDKFYQLLLAFSHYVLVKTAYAEHGLRSRDVLRYPVISHQAGKHDLPDVITKTVYAGTIRQRQRFLTKAQETVAIQDQWKLYAGELVRSHRSLCKSQRELERSVRAEMQVAADRNSSQGSLPVHKRRSDMPEYDFDVESVRRAQKVQKVRDLWKQVEDFNSSQAEDQEIVESILEGTLDKYRIDATQLNVKVPDLLLRECEREIQRRNVDNVYQGGKLNLVSLFHLWNLSLHLYIEKLHQAGVPNFENVEASVTSQVHTHSAHLTNTQSLRRSLERDFLPAMKLSIQQLKEKLDAELMMTKSPNSLRTTSLGLGLLPPTPPVNFDPAEGKNATDTALREQLSRASDVVSTPEAASQLIDTIHQKVQDQHNTSSLSQGCPVYGPKAGIRGDTHIPSLHPLSTREGVGVQKGSSKQRLRFHSAPGTAHGPTKALKKFGPAVKVTPSGTTIEVHPREPVNVAKHNLTAQASRQHTPIAKRGLDKQVAKTSAREAKTINNKHQAISITPHVQKHSDVFASFTTSPKAHDLLAEQIADAVMSGNALPQEHNLLDPTSALDLAAFKSRDKLQRTPEDQTPGNQHEKHGNTWHDTLLQDSLGPLSSTRIDQDQRVPIDRQEAEQVATKLFSPEQSDDEENIITTGAATDVLLHRTPPHDGDTNQNNNQLDSSHISEGVDLCSPSPRQRTSSLKDTADSISLPSVSDIHSVEGSRRQSVDCNSQPGSPGGVATDNLIEFSLGKTHQGNGSTSPVDLPDVQDSYRDLLESQTPQLPSRMKKDATVASSLPERVMLSLGSPYHQSPEQSHSLPPSDTHVIDSRGTAAALLSTDLSDHNQPSENSTLEEIENGTQTARLIEFQNGSFSEVVVKTPSKSRLSQSADFSRVATGAGTDALSSTMPTSGGGGGGSSGKGTGRDIEELSLPSVLKESVDSETDSLIARFRRLRLASQQVDKKARDKLLRVDTDSETLQVAAAATPSPLGEMYLQRTPEKICRSNGFQENNGQDLAEDNDLLPGDSFQLEEGLQDEDFSDIREAVLAESPFRTPVGTPRKGAFGSPKTPILKLSSLPPSPMTAFHSWPAAGGMQTTPGMADDIFAEDDTVLLLESPENQEKAAVGQLIDL